MEGQPSAAEIQIALTCNSKTANRQSHRFPSTPPYSFNANFNYIYAFFYH